MNINMELRRDENSKKKTFKQMWCLEQYRRLRRTFPQEDYNDSELKKFVVEMYDKNYKERNGRLFNNVDQKNTVMSVENYINKYLNEDLILTGYDCLYKAHDKAINIGSLALESLLATRKVNKKKMEAADYGSDEYIYYKVLQLSFKVLANSYYGILGEANSIFYNPFVQNSITVSGQSLITSSITTMEAFLANNITLRLTDDFICYLDNILTDDFKFNPLEFIDKPKSLEEVFNYFKRKCSERVNLEVVYSQLKLLSDVDLNRIYWKNNLAEFMEQSWAREKMKKITEFEFTTEINDAVKDDLNELRDVIIDVCYYEHIFYNKQVVSLEGNRDVICTIDTD